MGLLAAALLVILLTACDSSAAQAIPTEPPTETAQPTSTPAPTTPVLVRFASLTPTRAYRTPTLVRARATTAPTPAKAAPTAKVTPKPTETLKPGTCPLGGCKTPQPECQIKGNIEPNGEKRYYLPGMPSYAGVTINPDAGGRWFCTEPGALLSGWRLSTK